MSTSGASAGSRPRRSADSYFNRAQLPLYSLIFILPILVLFEVCTALHPSDPIAFRLMQVGFEKLGADGRFLPALALVGILLTWHIARKDPWQVKFNTLWKMALESWALSLPLLLLAIAVARWNMHLPLATHYAGWRSDAVLSLGAGIYEETVFRLMLMTLLMVLLADIASLPAVWANLLMVLCSAVLFSLYHYLGSEPFQMRSFIFRTIAGIYFAGLFLTRGFGITAGSHVAYDIMLIGVQAFAVR